MKWYQNTKLDFCIQKYYNEENVLFKLVRMSSLLKNQADSWGLPQSSPHTSTQKIRHLVAATALSLTAGCVTITTKPPQAMWMDQERFSQPEFVTDNPTLRNIYPFLQEFERTNNTSNIRLLTNLIRSEAASGYENKTLSHEQLLTLRDGLNTKAQNSSGDRKWQYYNLSCTLGTITDPRLQCLPQEESQHPSTLHQQPWNSTAFSPDILPNTRQNIREQREYQETPIDFRIRNARAIIEEYNLKFKKEDKEYKLASWASFSPIIQPVWPNTYSMKLTFLRDSRSSNRNPREVELTFFYDGYELTFFWDKNHDGRIDNENKRRWEWKSTTQIQRGRQWTRNGNTVYERSPSYRIQLDKTQITDRTGVKYIELEIEF